jgi:hypothetical protein
MHKSLLIVLFALPLTLQAQRAKGFRYNAAQYQLNAQKRGLDDRRGRPMPLVLSLRPFCPTPQDQGAEPSCTAWATAYGAMTVQYALARRVAHAHDVDKIACSKSFVYNALLHDSTATIEATFDFLKANGTCLAATFGNHEPTDNQPDALAKAEARGFRLLQMEEVYNPDTNIAQVRQVRRFKRLLADSVPMVVGMRLPYSFSNLMAHRYHPEPDEPLDSAAHALCLIGYDDVDSTFELMNSWGTTWGQEGFVRIHYQDFLRMLCCAYRMAPQFVLPRYRSARRLEVVVRRPNGYDNAQRPRFEEVRVALDTAQHCYRPQQTPWHLGQGCQLVLRQVPPNWWVQAYSYAPQSGLVALYDAQVPPSAVEPVLPSEDRQIEPEEPGTERLFLYCGPERNARAVEAINQTLAQNKQGQMQAAGALPMRMGFEADGVGQWVILRLDVEE